MQGLNKRSAFLSKCTVDPSKSKMKKPDGPADCLAPAPLSGLLAGAIGPPGLGQTSDHPKML